MARQLSPQDVVPRLRADLNVTAPPMGAGAEVIRVGPIDSGDRVALHGFEFSIAQMLDGKRTVADVVLACERLGLPVELEALQGFLAQLRSYGLLAPGHAAGLERQRAQWTAAVRSLFRSALREARTHNLDEARLDLEQLLRLAPQTPEALALKRWLDTPGANATDFDRLLREVEQSWTEERTPAWHELVRAAVRRSPGPFLTLAAIVVALIALAAVPLPRVVTAGAVLSPVAEVPVLSPGSGVIDEVRVHEGDRVAAGQVLFTWDPGELDLRLFQANARLESAREPLREAAGRTESGAPWWALLQQAEADLAQARSALLAELDDAKGALPGEALSRADARMRAAQARADAAREVLDEVGAPLDSVEAMRAQDFALEVAALETQRTQLEVVAPTAGTVSRMHLLAGGSVAQGQQVLQLDDLSRLKMVAATTARQAATIQSGEPATLRFGAVRAKTTLEAISGYELAAEVANPDGALRPGSAPVDIELAPRSIFSRLLR